MIIDDQCDDTIKWGRARVSVDTRFVLYLYVAHKIIGGGNSSGARNTNIDYVLYVPTYHHANI